VDHTHALDLFGGKETKLNLLDRAQRRLRIWEEDVRHIGEVVIKGGDEKNAEMTGEDEFVKPGLTRAQVVNVAKTGVTDVPIS
jgi:hypothetical protein